MRGGYKVRAWWDPRQWPLIVHVWALVMAFAAVFAVDALFHPKTHPLHWLSALAGALLGVAIGSLWFRWRGDLS